MFGVKLLPFFMIQLFKSRMNSFLNYPPINWTNKTSGHLIKVKGNKDSGDLAQGPTFSHHDTLPLKLRHKPTGFAAPMPVYLIDF